MVIFIYLFKNEVLKLIIRSIPLVRLLLENLLLVPLGGLRLHQRYMLALVGGRERETLDLMSQMSQVHFVPQEDDLVKFLVKVLHKLVGARVLLAVAEG